MKKKTTPEKPKEDQGKTRNVVGTKCISFTETLLKTRRSSLSNSEANRFGKDLFSWFSGVGALTKVNAPLAAKSVDLGITLLKSSIDSPASIVREVQSAYNHYSSA